MKHYPLRFYPILKERIWGGKRLATELGKATPSEKTGESWELSGVDGDVSIVSNGPLKGKSLTEVIASAPETWLGTKTIAKYGTEFPILIKFIDAASDLSIQVHPDDDLAAKRHNSFGKNEMWYIMDAEKDARLILGFDKPVTREEYLQNLKANTLTEILMEQPVQEGDAFFIHAGMIHAIGGGIMLAEIQQTSDVTYRLYDYNRKDADGNTRELHTEQALDAIDFNAVQPKPATYKKLENTANELITTPYFQTRYIRVKGSMELFKRPRPTFSIFMGTKGSIEITTSQGAQKLAKGQTLLIPAATDWVSLTSDSGEMLDITI